jgi:hypothetical protein
MSETTERVYRFIREFMAIHDTSPSYAQIADGCRIALGSVGRHLAYLEGRGRLKRTTAFQRGMTLTEARDD